MGGILGLAFPLWISIGAYTADIDRPKLNSTVEMCINYTATNFTTEPPRYDEDM